MTFERISISNITNLILVGAGGTSGDVLALIEAINQINTRYRVLGLLDDNPALQGAERYGMRVLGTLADGSRRTDAFFVDCLGSPANFTRRETILREQGFGGQPFATIIHPTAFIARGAKLGPGCIIFPHVVILSGVSLGAHVTVLAGSVLNHDVAVGDYSIIASGANISGGVRVGQACYIGAGANIREGVLVGDRALVGLGSAVVRDVAAETVVAGAPARPLRARR